MLSITYLAVGFFVAPLIVFILVGCFWPDSRWIARVIMLFLIASLLFLHEYMRWQIYLSYAEQCPATLTAHPPKHWYRGQM